MTELLQEPTSYEKTVSPRLPTRAANCCAGKGQSVMKEVSLLRLGVGHRKLPGASASLWWLSPAIISPFPFIEATCQPLSPALRHDIPYKVTCMPPPLVKEFTSCWDQNALTRDRPEMRKRSEKIIPSRNSHTRRLWAQKILWHSEAPRKQIQPLSAEPKTFLSPAIYPLPVAQPLWHHLARVHREIHLTGKIRQSTSSEGSRPHTGVTGSPSFAP